MEKQALASRNRLRATLSDDASAITWRGEKIMEVTRKRLHRMFRGDDYYSLTAIDLNGHIWHGRGKAGQQGEAPLTKAKKDRGKPVAA